MKENPFTTNNLIKPRLQDYTLHAKAGEGGFGYIYQGEQISTGQKVAIKMLKLSDDLDEQKRNYQIARFERETRLCAELNHPNIVKLLDKGYTPEKTPFAVFEFVEGETLKDLIGRKGNLTPHETQELMSQVLDALSGAHSKGIVHRDLKPHNIMVTSAGSQKHIKILDFGIGAFTREYQANDYQSLTLTREVMGTPAYSAPEQLRGEPATVKSDLYAWGLITLECLTGKPVMQGESVAEVFQQQLNMTNIPLTPAVAGHPLADVLRKVLQKNARQRSADAKTVWEQFRKINPSTLVGKISSHENEEAGSEPITQANQLAWNDFKSEKRQITVLCVKLNLSLSPPATLDMETLDTLQRDQMSLCEDVGARYGGHIAGSLAGCLSIYFGYPQVSDNDARRAGRAALDLMGQIRRRSALLEAHHGIRLEVRMGMHSGTVLSKPNQTPEGLVPNLAFNLLFTAGRGSILVSYATRKLLDPFLEFEQAAVPDRTHLQLPELVYTISGERQTEALSFLRPWSANRDMIGRDEEKNRVLGHWKEVKQGQGKAVILGGQAGIGKSKMVYEIKKQVRSEGFPYREARCLPEHQNNALFPFFSMLRSHWGIAELNKPEAILQPLERELTNAGCNLQEGLPILCSWLSIPLSGKYKVSEATPDVQKQILFNLLKQSLYHIGSGNPFILVLEDLHWLDPTGHEFVEFMLKDLHEKPLMLAMTTRPVFTPTWEGTQMLHLEPLNSSGTEGMVRGVLGGKEIAPKAMEYISQRTDGIPLYIEELTRLLEEEGHLHEVKGQYQLSAESDIRDIPNTLQDLLNARLNRLGPAKETAQLAATIGREFNYDLLVKASLSDEATVQRDLDKLIDKDLIYRHRRVNDETYVFRHALIRDAAYEGMVGAARKESHLRVAETLEQIVPRENFRIANHWAGGEEFSKAAKTGLESIHERTNLSQFEDALRQSKTALEWAKEVSDETLKNDLEFQIHQSLVKALIATRGFGDEEVRKANDRTEELFLRMPEEHEEVRWLLWNRIQFNLLNGDFPRFQELWDKAIKLAQKSNDIPFLSALHSVMACKYFISGEFEQSISEINQSVEHYDKASGKDIVSIFGLNTKCYALGIMANICALRGKYQDELNFRTQASESAKKNGNGPSIANQIYQSTLIPILQDDRKELTRLYSQHFPYLREANFTSHIRFFELIDALLISDISQAKTSYKNLIKSGRKAEITLFGYLVSRTALTSGDFEEALKWADKHLDLGEKTGEVFMLPDLHGLKAIALYKLNPKNELKIQQCIANALNQARKQGSDLQLMHILHECYNTIRNDAIRKFCKEQINSSATEKL
ncbi:MAG: TOMM system kinase/cyclase fusion protein [Bacteroidia bacterium]|nr:TOMM system kinase/cyclase fusion protein [Bacteroidia bacterium]